MVIFQKSNNRCAWALTGTAVLIAVTAAPVSAEDRGPYGSIGVVYATSDAAEVEQVSEDSGHVQLRAGYSFSRYFAVETEGSIAVLASDAGQAGSNDGRLILDRNLAGFAVASYPITQKVDVFVRGGYHYSRINLRADQFEQSVWRDGFAYGAGATYRIDEGRIRLDYTALETDLASETVNHRLITLSYVISF